MACEQLKAVSWLQGLAWDRETAEGTGGSVGRNCGAILMTANAVSIDGDYPIWYRFIMMSHWCFWMWMLPLHKQSALFLNVDGTSSLWCLIDVSEFAWQQYTARALWCFTVVAELNWNQDCSNHRDMCYSSFICDALSTCSKYKRVI